jgi:hypothetical protein
MSRSFLQSSHLYFCISVQIYFRFLRSQRCSKQFLFNARECLIPFSNLRTFLYFISVLILCRFLRRQRCNFLPFFSQANVHFMQPFRLIRCLSGSCLVTVVLLQFAVSFFIEIAFLETTYAHLIHRMTSNNLYNNEERYEWLWPVDLSWEQYSCSTAPFEDLKHAFKASVL